TTPAEVETFHVHFPPEMIKAPERLVRMDQAILDSIEAIPGVSSADFSSAVPMDAGAESGPVQVEDHMLQGQLPPARRLFWVSPSFFRTMGIPTVAGRDLTWDDVLNKRPLAIVSENLAREYWHNPSDALGKQIGSPKAWRQIVGVVGNVYDDGTSREAPATVYWPITDAGVYERDPASSVVGGPRSSALGSPHARLLLQEFDGACFVYAGHAVSRRRNGSAAGSHRVVWRHCLFGVTAHPRNRDSHGPRRA